MAEKEKGPEQELQIKVVQLKYLEDYFQDLLARENLLVSSYNDIENAEETVNELSKRKGFETLVYIGGGMYIAGSINATEKVLVNVGANVIIEKRLNEALAFIQEKKEEIKRILNDINQQKQQTASAIQRLREDVENSIRKRQTSG
ncbi:MAG: prefoldin subunit alpha [Nitrososphaeria archaeon]